MANVKISALPASAGLDGTEIVPIVDGGVTQRTTTQAIANLATSPPVVFVSSGGTYLAQSDDPALGVALANDDLSAVLGVVDSDAGSGIVGQTTGNVSILANTANANMTLSASGTNGQMIIQASGLGGSVALDSPTVSVHANEDASLFVDGGAGVYATAADNKLLLAAPVGNAIVDIQANGSGGAVTITASGTGGSMAILSNESIGLQTLADGSTLDIAANGTGSSLNFNAENITFNGSPYSSGGINEVWVSGANFAGNGDGFVNLGGSNIASGYGFPSGQNRFGIVEIAIPAGWTTFTVTYFVTNAGDNNLGSDYTFESSYQLAGQGTVLNGAAVAHTQTFDNAGANTLAVFETADIAAGGARILNYLVRSNNATQGVVTQIVLLGLLLTKTS